MGCEKNISRKSFIELTGMVLAAAFIPAKARETLVGDEIKRSWVDLEVYTSSDFNLTQDQIKTVNLEAKSAYDFANRILSRSFKEELEDFSVVGVTPVVLKKHSLTDFNQKQMLVHLLGRDKFGDFSFNLLKMGRYYPLFNLTELPPVLKETPERMPVITFPKDESEGAYTKMWNETSFQICPTVDRTVFLLPTKNIPESRLAAWLVDFSGKDLPDLIYDGEKYNGVNGGIMKGRLVVSSSRYNPGDQNFQEAPPVKTSFYIERTGSEIFAINDNKIKVGRAVRDLDNDVWNWID